MYQQNQMLELYDKAFKDINIKGLQKAITNSLETNFKKTYQRNRS